MLAHATEAQPLRLSDELFYASELGLIGKQHFAVDGCKLPSNASKRWSGTHQELRDKCKKLEDAAEAIVQKHRQRDAVEKRGTDAQLDTRGWGREIEPRRPERAGTG